MKTTHILPFVLAACVLALAGCASTGSTVDTTNQAFGAPAEKQSVRFPDAGSAWLKGGTFIDVEQLRRIGRGMSKNQVRELISYPHFSEGLFGPREWDYLFNFRTGRGDEFITCQYKVVFKDGVSDAMYWKEPACADALKPKVAEVVRPAPVVAAVPERIRLGADALFAFDKSGPADILPAGKRQLQELVVNLKSKYRKLDAINIVGHTDRLGGASYNQSLSLARANTVRDVLAQAGIDPSLIHATAGGETQPVVACAASLPRPALVSCLQPNRRVDLEVLGQ